jgi:hypothetical protein
MATDKRNELLTTYTTDVAALITHGLQAIQRQVENLKKVSHVDAKNAVTEFERILKLQKSTVDSRIAALGGSTTKPMKDAVSALAGVAAGFINAVRPSETTKSLRDDHTFFNHLGVAWLMLHTTALALGDLETARVAERGYNETARCIMHIDSIIPKVVVEELREEVKAADVEDQTRRMVKDAWNRDAAGFGAASTSPNQPRPVVS